MLGVGVYSLILIRNSSGDITGISDFLKFFPFLVIIMSHSVCNVQVVNKPTEFGMFRSCMAVMIPVIKTELHDDHEKVPGILILFQSKEKINQ